MSSYVDDYNWINNKRFFKTANSTSSVLSTQGNSFI